MRVSPHPHSAQSANRGVSQHSSDKDYKRPQRLFKNDSFATRGFQFSDLVVYKFDVKINYNCKVIRMGYFSVEIGCENTSTSTVVAMKIFSRV